MDEGRRSALPPDPPGLRPPLERVPPRLETDKQPTGSEATACFAGLFWAGYGPAPQTPVDALLWHFRSPLEQNLADLLLPPATVPAWCF